jgi:DNA-binding HxlR family transcriptional regulator
MNTTVSQKFCSNIERCPIETTLSVVGGKWIPMIIYHLRGGPKRFGVLRRLIPTVTQRMLTSHLRELEAHGIIHREIFYVVPPHVEYSLTELGHSLTPIMMAMAEWGEAFEAQRQREYTAVSP